MCDSSRLIPSHEKMTATSVELHDLRGLYMLRFGGIGIWVSLLYRHLRNAKLFIHYLDFV